MIERKRSHGGRSDIETYVAPGLNGSSVYQTNQWCFSQGGPAQESPQYEKAIECMCITNMYHRGYDWAICSGEGIDPSRCLWERQTKCASWGAETPSKITALWKKMRNHRRTKWEVNVIHRLNGSSVYPTKLNRVAQRDGWVRESLMFGKVEKSVTVGIRNGLNGSSLYLTRLFCDGQGRRSLQESATYERELRYDRITELSHGNGDRGTQTQRWSFFWYIVGRIEELKKTGAQWRTVSREEREIHSCLKRKRSGCWIRLKQAKKLNKQFRAFSISFESVKKSKVRIKGDGLCLSDMHVRGCDRVAGTCKEMNPWYRSWGG